MPTKNDLVIGAYQLIRISGLTSQAIPEEITIGVQVSDDLAGELSATLDTGYIQPVEYGASDPNDYSGLTAQTAGPFKKLLAMELVDFFGKQVPISLKMNADKGLRSLEQLLVNVLPLQNPGTLPMGSGNEWSNNGYKFYPEPIGDDGADYHYKTDIFPFYKDWSQWLSGAATLASVEYEFNGGIVLSAKSITDDTSTVTVSFSRVGQVFLCAKATDSNGNVTSEKVIYNVVDCNQNYYP
tara:strand:+ start:429 stop:1148 length:720 start_codon:yes stop_codon:yes gene_type:complete